MNEVYGMKFIKFLIMTMLHICLVVKNAVVFYFTGDTRADFLCIKFNLFTWEVKMFNPRNSSSL